MQSRQIPFLLCSFLILLQLQGCVTGVRREGSRKPAAVEVAIIGGGLSGLTAAHRLKIASEKMEHQNLSLKVHVYEARKRLGGRVFTTLINGAPIEMGGQYFEDGGDAKEIRQLVEDLGLKTKTYSRISPSLFLHEESDKKSLVRTQLLKMLEDVIPKVERMVTDRDRAEIVQLLKSLEMKSKNMDEVLNGFFGAKAKKALAEGNGERAHAYSVLNDYYHVGIMIYESMPTSRLAPTYATGSFLRFFLSMEDDYRTLNEGKNPVPFVGTSVDGGNAKLVEALERSILAKDGDIQYGMPLTELRKELNESYTLTFKNGERAHADIVVMTVPTTVYKNIQFVGSPIPHAQLEEIKKIPYGSVGKIQMPVQSEDPTQLNGSLRTSDMVTWFNGDRVRDAKNPSGVMTFYFSGNSSLLAMPFDRLGQAGASSDKETGRRYEEELNAVRLAFPHVILAPHETPDLVQAPLEKQFVSYTQPVGINWAVEEYSKGGYSAISFEQAALFSPEQLRSYLGETVFQVFQPVLPSINVGNCDYCGLYFAGEHTATQGTPATLEGAVHSGNKVGRQIPVRLREVGEELVRLKADH